MLKGGNKKFKRFLYGYDFDFDQKIPDSKMYKSVAAIYYRELVSTT